MFRACLYCDEPMSGPDGLRIGVRMAFDPERGRIWTVCAHCHGWNLWPLEDRAEALVELERIAARSRLLYQTKNIGLLDTGSFGLIRVGRAELQEKAWWRYGRTLRRRHSRYRSPVARVSAASYSAVSFLGANVGLSGITGDFRGATDRYADIRRWRAFGHTAWTGRARCPQCSSVLIRLFFFKTEALVLLPAESRPLAIGMPCTRCDPWTVDKVHRFDRSESEQILRRALAYQNIAGASRTQLDRAVREIERAGSARRFIRRIAAGGTLLYELGRTERLALEISVNEDAERSELAQEGVAVEAAWRRSEELAAIIDGELC